MKQFLRGKRFANVEEMKRKLEEAKGVKIYESKSCFEQWKKVSIGVLHQMESTLRGAKV